MAYTAKPRNGQDRFLQLILYCDANIQMICRAEFPKVNCNSCTRYRHYDIEDIPAILAIPDTLFFLPAFPFSDYCLKHRKAQFVEYQPEES